MPKDVAGVMHEFKHGELHSGSSSGPKVTNRKQAIAIALSEQRQLGKGKSAPRRTAPVSRRSSTPSLPVEPPTPTGFGSLSHRPKVFDNPSSFAGRREASRKRYI